MKSLKEFFRQKPTLKDKINGSVNIEPKFPGPSFTNIDLWSTILFYLHPNDFFKMGRVALWFYKFTRNKEFIKKVNEYTWAYLFYPHELAKNIITNKEIKDLVVSGKNNVLFAYFADDINSENLKINCFELLLLSLNNGNFIAFRFLTDIIIHLVTEDVERVLDFWKQLVTINLLVPCGFGFKFKHNSQYEAQRINYLQQIGLFPLYESKKKEIWCKLIHAGPQYIFNVLQILYLYGRFFKSKNIEYRIGVDILGIAKEQSPEVYQELLKSKYRHYLMELDELYKLEVQEIHSDSIFKNALSLVPNKSYGDFFKNQSNENKIQVLEMKIDKLEKSINDSVELISKLRKELEQIKSEKLSFNSLTI